VTARAALPRASARRTTAPLGVVQIRWLGALLVCAQLPQAPHLPLWIAAFGLALVGLRFVLLRRDRLRPDAPPARIPSWTLVLFAVFATRRSRSCSSWSGSSSSKPGPCATARCSSRSRRSCW
jgi:hypothetical protein